LYVVHLIIHQFIVKELKQIYAPEVLMKKVISFITFALKLKLLLVEVNKNLSQWKKNKIINIKGYGK